MELLSKPLWRRPSFTEEPVLDTDKLDMDIFMLVEVDVPSISPDTLHQGLNRLWVQSGTRRDDWVTEMFMGELEIVTARKF